MYYNEEKQFYNANSLINKNDDYDNKEKRNDNLNNSLYEKEKIEVGFNLF